MPYIKLGSKYINYISTYEDTFIATMITESQCSNKYPVLVRSNDELDIYFGRNFILRDYLSELIKRRVTLYLYKPISPDISEYYNDNELDINVPEKYKEFYNRDTLRLINLNGQFGKQLTFDHCYPEYNKPYKFNSIDREFMNSIDIEELEYGYESLNFILDFTKVDKFYPDNKTDDPYYITLSVNKRNVMLWFRYTKEIYIPPIGGDFIGPSVIEVKTYDESTGDQLPRDSILDKVIDALQKEYIDGYGNIGFGYKIKSISEDKNIINIYRPYQENFTDFNLLPGFNISTDFRGTHDLLSEISERGKRIEFYSKTIGPNDENIKVKIESINYDSDKYRITISRFNYEEIFEVNLYNDINELSYKNESTSIEYVINSKSKLVECKVFNLIDQNGTQIPIKEPLPLGEWELKGSRSNNYNIESRRNSLMLLKDLEVIDDILLINDINDWAKIDESQEELSDNSTVDMYKLFLDYNIIKDNQTLIPNRNKEHIYNFTEDKDNRLVYLYGDMYIGLNYRPPYYILLNGLIDGSFSVSSNNAIVGLPESIGKIKELDRYKSNYLTYDNYEYFYYSYSNSVNKSDNYNTSILTRFVISYINREFVRNKWSIVGLQSANARYNSINKLISKIANKYNYLIKSLEIDNYKETISKRLIELKLKLNVSEIVDKDIYLNLIINYYK